MLEKSHFSNFYFSDYKVFWDIISFRLLAGSHWRRRHQIPLKRWYLSIKLHDISSHNNAFLILAVRTTNLTYWIRLPILLPLFVHILQSRRLAKSSSDLQNFICKPLPVLSEGFDGASNLSTFSYSWNSGFKSQPETGSAGRDIT
jgi:hypothetical protein